MADTLRPFEEPFARFRALLDEAIAVDRTRLPEPTAFALGTVSPDGQPAVRIVLLKAVDPKGFVFYTNYESRKGRELLATKKAAMCFHWQPMEKQVRVEGDVETVTAEEADAYFASRIRGSQVGAWASRQSQPMSSRHELEERYAEVEARYAGKDVPRPPHWSGFRIVPRVIEFWHAMPSRLHERERYERRGDGWATDYLFP